MKILISSIVTIAVVAAQVDQSIFGSIVRQIRETLDEGDEEFDGDIELNFDDEREIDLILAQRATRGGGKKNKNKNKEQKQKSKKTKQVLRLLKFAEPDRKSRDWLEYGCYCFADIKTDILSPGIGKAIDSIDRACRTLSDCLKCSEYDYQISKKCNPHVGYKYESVEDLALGLRSITCLNEKDSCQRAMCECDRKFLQSVQEHNYEASNSPNGGFDKPQECPKHAQRKEDGNVGEANGSKTVLAQRMTPLGEAEDNLQCCGPPGERHVIKVTQTKGCCRQQTYNPFLFDCCLDGQVAPVGLC